MGRLSATGRLALAALCVSIADGRFVVEKGGLHVKFPKSAARAHKHGFDMSLANFGSPLYGGELTGRLVYVEKNHKHKNVCNPPCNYACQDFSKAQPPFKLNPNTDPDYPGQHVNYIMLVDRGPLEDDMQPCKFAEKVLNAQKAGAHAVLVVNYEDKHTTMEAPDDKDEASYTYLRNITIPAAFITKSDGQALKDLLKPDLEEVHVVLDWKDVLPRAEKVEWEFWTNSNNQCGAVCDAQKEFIKEFVPVARQLEGQYTRFTPHYVVWVCPLPYRNSDDCQSQCIHKGRYCTPDPDGDLEVGYSGRDIVAENLRQLCVFSLANESGKPWVWWDYVTKFGDECRMDDNNYTEECAERVFGEVGGSTWSSLSALRECIGNVNSNDTNAIMEVEMKRQRGGGSVGEVYIMPTIRINNGQYRGKVKYTEVLHALCAGFTKGTEPPACRSVGEDACREGSAGQTACAMRMDGKTKCTNTLGGFECTCGPGFTPHTDEHGAEKCLDINECLIAEARDLDPKCTCERCACKDIYGSYECIENIPDECAKDHGGCWHGEFSVKGETKTFSACKDNLEEYKDAAARKKPLDKVKLHECKCPACFTEFNKGKDSQGNDILECVPKCDLDLCDEPTGICTIGPNSYGHGGLSAWAVVLIVVASLSVVAGGAFGLYKWRLRNAMHQEIRAIMAQYMPLESTEAQNAANNTLVHDSATKGKAPATPTTPEQV